jgi:hypothetical protein
VVGDGRGDGGVGLVGERGVSGEYVSVCEFRDTFAGCQRIVVVTRRGRR